MPAAPPLDTLAELYEYNNDWIRNDATPAFQALRANTLFHEMIRMMGTIIAGGGGQPTIPFGTVNDYWRGDQTWQILNNAAVGLGNVPNINATIATNLSSGTIPAGRYGALTIPVTAINATGTASSTTVLFGDGTWGTPTVPDGDKGDITVSGGGTVWTINAGGINLTQFPDIASNRVLGRILPGSGPVAELTGTDITPLLAVFTSTDQGVVPQSGGGTTNFLRADGVWAAPAGSGGVPDGDYGDITVSSGGTVWTIDPATVSLAKMANMATASFLGRNTAGTGSPEVLSIATVKTMLGLTGTNSGDVTLAGENYLTIAGQVITANAVNLSGTHVTGTLAAARIAGTTTDGFVATLVAGVPTWQASAGGGLSDGDKGDITVSSSGTVWTIDNNAVTTAKINALAVTDAKINDVAFSKVTGIMPAARIAGTATDGFVVSLVAGVPTWTETIIADITSPSDGDVLTYDNTTSTWINLPPVGASATNTQVVYGTGSGITSSPKLTFQPNLSSIDTLTLGNAAISAQMKLNYPSGGSADFTGQMGGTDMMSFGFASTAPGGVGTTGTTGRAIYMYDRVAAAFRFILNSDGTIRLNGYGGSGAGFLAVDNDGDLSWSAGAGGASATANEVVYGTGAGITSSPRLVFDPAGSSISMLTLGDATFTTQMKMNYPVGGGGDFTGQLAGVDMLSFGFSNGALGGIGSSGASSGRTLYVYDRVAAAFRLFVNSDGTIRMHAYGGSGAGFLAVDNEGDLSWAASPGGVTTMAAIGSSPNANGASISGVTLTLQPADGSFGGVVTTAAQTFAGHKTFTDASFAISATAANVPVQINHSVNGNGIARAVSMNKTGTYTAAANDGLSWDFGGRNSAGSVLLFASIDAVFTTITAGSEVGAFSFKSYNGAGSIVEQFRINGNASITIPNGTAPSASVANSILLYSEDVAASAELKVRDEAGNITVLSPHNFSKIPKGRSEEMAWAYYSEREDKYINVDMLKVIRVIEEKFGIELVHTGNL